MGCAWLVLSHTGHFWALAGENASQAHGDCGAVSLCRHQIWLLCVYFFVQKGEKPFSLWQEQLSVCPCYRFLQEQSLCTATKDAITSLATHFPCRSSWLCHAVMVNLTPHTIILSACVLDGLFQGFFGEGRWDV